MGYHDLSQCTLTADERQAEAVKIAEILSDSLGQMLSNERDVVERLGNGDSPVSVKQLFWLRDIKDKYE